MPQHMNRWAIDIDRDDITRAAIVAEPEAPLADSAVEVAVELFAVTANNVTYDALRSLDAALPTALIDIAGNPGVTRAVHQAFGDQLRLSLVVGKAHWDAESTGGPLPGPRQSGFFAPGRIEKRAGEWGGAELTRRMDLGWSAFIADVPALTRLDRRHGAEGALAAWREAVAGTANPRASVIVDSAARA